MKKTIIVLLVILMALSLQGCTKKITDLYISQKTAEIESDEKLQLKVTVFPEDAGTESIKWTSADTDIAVVDNDGLVTPVSAGNTTIICSAPSGIKVSCELTVKPPSAIKLLNSKERELFDYLLDSLLPITYNASAMRIRNIYGDATTTSITAYTLDIQGTNRLGGTVYKQYTVIKLDGKFSIFDLSNHFDRSSATVMDPKVLDYTKINAALEEYWSNSSIK